MLIIFHIGFLALKRAGIMVNQVEVLDGPATVNEESASLKNHCLALNVISVTLGEKFAEGNWFLEIFRIPLSAGWEG